MLQRFAGGSVTSQRQGWDRRNNGDMDSAAPAAATAGTATTSNTTTAKNGGTTTHDGPLLSAVGHHTHHPKNGHFHHNNNNSKRRPNGGASSSSCWRRCYCCCTMVCLVWCIFAIFLTTAHIASQYHYDADNLSAHSSSKASIILDHSSPKAQQQQQPPPASLLTTTTTTTTAAKPLTKRGNIRFASWEEMVQEKIVAVRSIHTPRPLPDAPLHLVRLNYNDNNNDENNDGDAQQQLPLVAIVTSTRSTTKTTKATDTMLWKYLIQSILKTVTALDRQHFRVELFVAVDDIDEWWLQHCHELEPLLQWLPVTFGVYRKRNHHIPFNEMAYTAYQEHEYNATYFCRVNDDTQFLSSQWITLAVQTLQNYDPPNIGVTGPACEQGNTNILTHDFVHRHHLEIFGGLYYPPAFNNWYLDDWISFVYSRTVLGPDFHRFSVLPTWKVKHWVRYTWYYRK